MYTRPDALVAEHVEAVARAKFVYLTGTSPMHMRSVLKDTPVFDAICAAWDGGAALAGSGAGADVLCDPMVDTRGGAFTVGLGLLPGMAVVARSNLWSPDKVRRTVELAPAMSCSSNCPSARPWFATPMARGALPVRVSPWSTGVGVPPRWPTYRSRRSAAESDEDPVLARPGSVGQSDQGAAAAVVVVVDGAAETMSTTNTSVSSGAMVP